MRSIIFFFSFFFLRPQSGYDSDTDEDVSVVSEDESNQGMVDDLQQGQGLQRSKKPLNKGRWSKEEVIILISLLANRIGNLSCLKFSFRSKKAFIEDINR